MDHGSVQQMNARAWSRPWKGIGQFASVILMCMILRGSAVRDVEDRFSGDLILDSVGPTNKSQAADDNPTKNKVKKNVTFHPDAKTHDSVPGEYIKRLTQHHQKKEENESFQRFLNMLTRPRNEQEYKGALEQIRQIPCGSNPPLLCKQIVEDQFPDEAKLGDITPDSSEWSKLYSRDNTFWKKVLGRIERDVKKFILQPCAEIMPHASIEVCTGMCKQFASASNKKYLFECETALAEEKGRACNSMCGATEYLGIAFDTPLKQEECATCYSQKKGVSCAEGMPKRQKSTPFNKKKTCCEVLNCSKDGSDGSLLDVPRVEKMSGCNVPRGASHYRSLLFDMPLPKDACAECFIQVTPYKSKSTFNKVVDNVLKINPLVDQILSLSCPQGYESMKSFGPQVNRRVCCHTRDLRMACNKFENSWQKEGYSTKRDQCDACAKKLNKSPLKFNKTDLKLCKQ